MTAPRLTGVLETSLYVENLDRSQHFYSRILGFETLLRDDRMCALAIPGMAVLLLFARGQSVTPTQTPGGTIPPHDGTGHLHLCFAIPVSTKDDWPAHLRAHDTPIESRVSWPRGGISYYIRDPDHHCIELATPGLWAVY